LGLDRIPESLHGRFRFEERHHALSILSIDFANEFTDLLLCLEAFRLRKSHILARGGPLSSIPKIIDGFLRARQWKERRFDIKITVDEKPIPIPTHKIDNFQEPNWRRSRME